jgi:ring-1,2-phenylacetyl-CoA epoxidase subunit PaaD
MNLTTELSIEQIKNILHQVKDPEIPTVSVVDLGVISDININANGHVEVEMIPTFSGCAAIHIMRFTIEQILKENGINDVNVTVNRNKAWSSDKLTPQGRQHLLDFGLSPPPIHAGDDPLADMEQALCPKCGSKNTSLLSPFGPTLCRAIHHCHDCSETFEQFKPV